MTFATESVVNQMQAVARMAAGGTPADASQAVSGGGFADELRASLHRVSAAQQSADTKAMAFELGMPGVALNDVMIDTQKAGIAFQMSLQVRNKLVSAYQEVMNMTV